MAHIGSLSPPTITSTTAVYSYSPTAGNSGYLFVYFIPTSGTFVAGDVTVADNATGGSSAWVNPTGGFTYNASPARGLWVFYCSSVKSGVTSITATIGNAKTATNGNGLLDEFSGNSVFVFDAATTAFVASIAAGTDAVTTGSVTINGADFLWAACIPRNETGSVSQGTGFTVARSDSPFDLSEYETTSAGSRAATFTNSATDDFNLCLLAFLPSAPLSGTIYIDSAIGSDGFDGTAQTVGGGHGPWATAANITLNSFNGGASILFKAGQTFSTNISIGVTTQGSSPAWSSSNPVTFGQYGAGANPIISVAGSSTIGFAALNIAGFVINGLDFVGPGIATGTVTGIQIQTNRTSGARLDYVQVINCNVSQFGSNGLHIWGNGGAGGATSGFSSVTISGGSYHDCTGASASSTAGVRVSGVYPTQNTHINVKITGVNAYNNTGATGQSNWSGTGIIIQDTAGTGLLDVNGNACGALIDNCVAHNNAANSSVSGGGSYGIWMAVVTGGVIQRCESYSTKTQTGDGGGYDLDGGCINCIIQYCYSHDNDGQGYTVYQYTDAGLADSSGNTVRYCISQNDGANATNTAGCCCMLGNDSGSTGQTGVAVYNNTFYTSRSAVPAVNLEGTGLANITGHVSNNIFYLNGATNFINNVFATGNPTGLVFSGNDYFTTGSFSLSWNGTTYTSFASWVAAATAQEPIAQRLTSPTVNPSLVSPGGGGTLGGYVPSSIPQYQLSFGSPMVGVGLDLNSLYSISPGSQDFYGNALPNGRGTGFNVGAYAGLPVTAVSYDAIGGCEVSLTARSANERRRTVWWS